MVECQPRQTWLVSERHVVPQLYPSLPSLGLQQRKELDGWELGWERGYSKASPGLGGSLLVAISTLAGVQRAIFSLMVWS